MSKDVYWTTKDGKKMNVDDMDDKHVRNAFKMVLRNIETFLQPRGDIAQMMHDDMDCCDAFDDMEPWDWRQESEND